ncbi:tetratricopeptide repeat protein [Aquariibacter albus]|uniref:Tetratricopeptide repeat protein n=1 Tax=Aquariibacter albus TaxID=2759899 RepID=A0A839HH28_9BURK|nr:tetratricopeptide repeat protein [Aquariibacter albus]MBB1161435.1 tetratricopeptide repeat protein [Aquariibacter albus]
MSLARLGALLLLATLALPAARAVAPEDLRFLRDKAAALESRGRGDLAAETWRQLLAVEPNDTEAIGRLGLLDAGAGRRKDAQEALVRLRNLAPSSPWLGRLEQSLALPAEGRGQIQDAGRAQARGDHAAAVKLYDQALAGAEPAPALAEAYFKALAKTPGGKAAAQRRLRALVAAEPDQPRYALVLGELLSYDAPTRREGVRLLLPLQDRADDTGPAARQAIANAKRWGIPGGMPRLGTPPAVNPVANLVANPVAVAPARAPVTRPAPVRRVTEAPRVAAAAPEVPLVRALPPLPRTAPRRVQPVESAPAAPREALVPPQRTPVHAAGAEGSEVQAGYAALRTGKLDEAERHFLSLSGRNPEVPAYIEGLAEVRMAQRRYPDALDLFDRLPASPKTEGRMREAMGYGALEIAGAEAEAGRSREALRYYRRADELLPNQIDVLSGLARAQSASGEREGALETLGRALQLQPENLGLWQTQNDLLAQAGQYETLLASERRMPAKVRSSLDRQIGHQLTLAQAAQQLGDRERSRKALDSAFLMHRGATPGQQLQLAWLLREQGETGLMQSVLGRLGEAKLDADQQRQFTQLRQLSTESQARAALEQGDLSTARKAAERLDAGSARGLNADIALKTAWQQYEGKQDAALYRNLIGLYQTPGLSEDQARQVRELFRYGGDREAGTLLQRKRTDDAAAIYEHLGGLFPDDAHYPRQLANVRLAAGQPAEALALLRELPAPASAAEYRAAVGAALGAGDRTQAAAWADEALQQFPEDRSLLGLAAQVDEANGRYGDALKRYQSVLRGAPGAAPAASRYAPAAPAAAPVPAPVRLPAFAGGDAP